MPDVYVSFDFNHWGAFLFNDFLYNLSVCFIFDFKTPVEGLHVRNLINLSLSMQSVDEGLENAKTHLSKGSGGLVTVNPTVQIRLPKGFQSKFCIEVE